MLRFCLIVSVCFLLLATPATACAEEGRPPNFVLIFTDDQGYNDVGCFGSPLIRTPHLDKMASEGTRFTDFYVSASVCSASRAALMTGTYNDRVDVPGVFFPNRGYDGLNPSEITIAEVLKSKGYATACFGKWHLGDEPEFLPTRQGFDTYFGIPYSNDMTVNPSMAIADDVTWRAGMTLEKMRSPKQKKRNWVPLLRDEKVVEYPVDQRTLTKRYTENAIAFMEKHKDKPFFVYLPHTMPHIPLFVSEAFKGHNPKRGPYGDTIEEIDWSVGQMLDAIRRLGIAENTIVIFCSDNGPWLRVGHHRAGSAAPLRDGKFSTYEGGMRVPMIAWGPGHVPAGATCNEIAATIDVLPTFADFAGADVPDDRVIDGKSIRSLLTDANAKSPHEAYFYRNHGVRVGKWKLLVKARSTRKNQPVGKLPQLFDLSADIGETTNLADEHPEIVKKLTAMIQAHAKSIQETRRPRGKVKPRR